MFLKVAVLGILWKMYIIGLLSAILFLQTEDNKQRKKKCTQKLVFPNSNNKFIPLDLLSCSLDCFSLYLKSLKNQSWVKDPRSY